MSTKMRKYRKIVDQITFTGPREKFKEAIDWLYKNGYRVTRSGPKPISRRKYDSSKFLIRAERDTLVKWSELKTAFPFVE